LLKEIAKKQKAIVIMVLIFFFLIAYNGMNMHSSGIQAKFFNLAMYFYS